MLTLVLAVSGCIFQFFAVPVDDPVELVIEVSLFIELINALFQSNRNRDIVFFHWLLLLLLS